MDDWTPAQSPNSKEAWAGRQAGRREGGESAKWAMMQHNKLDDACLDEAQDFLKQSAGRPSDPRTLEQLPPSQR